jgi:hypothetical protein
MRLKHTLHQLLERGELEPIARMASGRHRVLGSLLALTYDRDPEIAWRAIEAMGLAAERVAESDPEAVRELLRKLYWLIMEESGGICWRAPEAMAEIVARLPRRFADYVPITLSHLVQLAPEDLTHFRPGALWAVGRLGEVVASDAAQQEAHGPVPDLIAEVLPAVVSALEAPESQARGMAAWCLAKLGRLDLLAERPDLRDDHGLVEVYEDRRLTRTRIGQLVKRLLAD